jgi:integrase
MSVPKTRIPGVTPIHVDDCLARGWDLERLCKCWPSAQAAHYDKRTDKSTRKNFRSSGDFKNFKAAEAWKREREGKQKRGELSTQKAPTFREARIERIERMADGRALKKGRKRFKPSSIRDHESALERAGLDFDPYTLDQVQRFDAMDYRDRVMADVGASRTRNLIYPVSGMYRDVIRRGLGVTVNPFADLELPAVEGTREYAGDAVAVRASLDALPEDLRALFASAAYASLRSGCIQALMPEYVTTEAITVRHSWDKKDGLVDPKTGAGRRTIPVCAHLWEYLGPHIAALPANQRFVFGSGAEPFNYGKVMRAATAAWKEAGLERVTLHQLRHSYRTFLNYAGVSRFDADIYMGHADESMGARYTHQPPGQLAADAALLDAYLDAATEGKVVPLRRVS